MNEKITTIKNKVIISESEGYMNELKIFQNSEFGTIRTLSINNEPWFIGKDVASILGYSNTRKALNDHVDDEDKGVTKCDTLGGAQEMTIINESGLYSLILSSKLPKAKEFKRWVTSEVLPSIRKTGGYIAGANEMSDEEIMAKALLIGKRTIEQQKARIEQLESDTTRMKPKEIFADAVSASKQSILVGELAKLLRQNGVEIGQNKLFAWLRENGYLIKAKRSDYSMPTQRSMNMKLFEIKETAITHSDGHVSVNKTVKVTGKGQVYFVNLFMKAVEAGH